MATFTAADGTRAAVNTAIGFCSDGDTVLIPDDDQTWTSGITTTKLITIQAQNYTPTNQATLSGTPPTPTNRLVKIRHNAGAATLFTLTATAGSFYTQLSGIAFYPAASNIGRYINFSGTGTPLLNDLYLAIESSAGGVADFGAAFTTKGGVWWNCFIESSLTSGDGSTRSWLSHKGTKPWLDADTWGMNDDGTNNMYLEDSIIINLRDFAFDGDDNSRSAFRHIRMLNSQVIHHGTTSLQGGRQMEIYDSNLHYRQNVYTTATSGWVNLNRYTWLRAGTQRISDNVIEEINSAGTYATRTSFVYIAESLTRSGSGSGCELESAYPNGTHWPGTGTNGATQTNGADPVRIWNNTGSGGNGTGHLWGTNDQADTCGNGQTTANVFLLNRDIFLSAPSSYTKFTYPHPLRNSAAPPDTTPPTQVVSRRILHWR